MLINKDTIIHDDNALLREKSINVSLPLSKEDKELLEKMVKYVDDSTNPEIAEKENLQPAVGIAAIQLGVKKKMTAIVIKNDNSEHTIRYALVNPKIISSSIEMAYLKNGEGCLSVPKEHQGYIYRPARVKVKAYDMLQDKEIVIKAKDYLAIVLQHEIDHFSGTLFYDHINKEDPFFVREDAISIE